MTFNPPWLPWARWASVKGPLLKSGPKIPWVKKPWGEIILRSNGVFVALQLGPRGPPCRVPFALLAHWHELFLRPVMDSLTILVSWIFPKSFRKGAGFLGHYFLYRMLQPQKNMDWFTTSWEVIGISLVYDVYHGKSLVTPNRNPTYNRHYLVDILVLTIG